MNGWISAYADRRQDVVFCDTSGCGAPRPAGSPCPPRRPAPVSRRLQVDGAGTRTGRKRRCRGHNNRCGKLDRNRSARVLAALALAGGCLPASAAVGQASQQPIVPAQQPTLQSGSGLISVDVHHRVTDTNQRLVPDLTIDGFEILRLTTSRNRSSSSTTRSADYRRSSMLDTSAQHDDARSRCRRAAAEQFVTAAAAADKGARRRVQRQDRVQCAIHQQPRRTGERCQDLDYGNGTRLWDADQRQSLDELKGVEGRRVILVFTDGDDTVEQGRPRPG